MLPLGERICEKCGEIISIEYGSGRFCSRKCANTRIISEEEKLKIKSSVDKKFIELGELPRICESCGTIFYSKDYSRKQCFECKPKTIKHIKVKKVPESLLDVSKRTVEKIIIRMELPCSCCGIFVPGVNWDIHHIIPRETGGTNDMHNLTYICPNCHRIAHTKLDLLPNSLIPLDIFLEALNKDWKDYYFGIPDINKELDIYVFS